MTVLPRHCPTVLFGVCTPKPLTGFPVGAVELIMHPERFVVARVTAGGKTCEYYVTDTGEHWEPSTDFQPIEIT